MIVAKSSGMHITSTPGPKSCQAANDNQEAKHAKPKTIAAVTDLRFPITTRRPATNGVKAKTTTHTSIQPTTELLNETPNTPSKPTKPLTIKVIHAAVNHLVFLGPMPRYYCKNYSVQAALGAISLPGPPNYPRARSTESARKVRACCIADACPISLARSASTRRHHTTPVATRAGTKHDGVARCEPTFSGWAGAGASPYVSTAWRPTQLKLESSTLSE
jgi:hypothetical protein